VAKSPCGGSPMCDINDKIEKQKTKENTGFGCCVGI
jgi:hypothetical protein